MAGDARFKGALQVGLIRFEVTAKAAVKEQGMPAFQMHHADCGGRVGMPTKCLDCDIEIARSETVKGYQGVWPVDPDALAALALDKNDTIILDAMVDASEIDARYYQKSYDVIAAKGAGKQYELVRRTLEAKGLVGVGKVVMRGREYIVIVRPRDGVLAMELSYWPAELEAATVSEAQASIEGITLSDQELALGGALVDMLTKPWNPGEYVNEQVAKVHAYLAAFVSSAGTAELPKPVKVEPKIASLEDVLAASLAAMSAAKPTEQAPVKARKGKVAA